MEDNAAIVCDTGFCKPLQSLTLDDRSNLCDVLRNYYTLIKVLPEINQFCDGLDAIGVLSIIKKYPEIMKHFFVYDTENEVTIDKGWA